MHPHPQKTPPQSVSPAVAATCLPPAGSSSLSPVAPAEAAGGRDYRSTDGWACPGIAPYKGWALYEADEWDGEGFLTSRYFARGPVEDVHLNASRFSFDPTDARFCWLIDNDFGRQLKMRSPFTSDDVDAAIARSVVTPATASFHMASATADLCGRILAGMA